MDETSTKLRVRDKPYYPKKTSIAIKKTSLLMDELALKREQESAYQLTPYESDRYSMLKSIFNTSHPADKISEAIKSEEELKSLRKEFLIASKIKKEKELELKKIEHESISFWLFAIAVPLCLVGAMLLDTQKSVGISVIISGLLMFFPALIKEKYVKRKAKKRLKDITRKVDSLSRDIDKKTKIIDAAMRPYGMPVNCTEKLKYMKPLCEVAKEYEILDQKVTDYELLVRVNGSNLISQQISKNLNMLSGLTVEDENQYQDVLDKLEHQLKF